MKAFKIITLVVSIFVVSSAGAYAADKDKIGYVDLSRLFDEYYVTKEYDTTLEAKHKEFEADRNTKIEKIRESQGKLGLLSDDKKAALEAEIEQKKADLLEYDRQQKADLTKERNDKIREILLEIEGVVSTYAEKENYSIILNDRVLIFGQQSYDVTEQVLKILNAGKK